MAGNRRNARESVASPDGSKASSGAPWVSSLRLAFALVAALGTFLPWVYLVPPTHSGAVLGRYNAYGLSPLSWLWLAIDVGLVAAGLFWRRPRPKWLDRLAIIFPAVSLGVAGSGPVFIQVAARVSSVLGAPTPVKLGYGAVLFTGAVLLWTATYLWRANV